MNLSTYNDRPHLFRRIRLFCLCTLAAVGLLVLGCDSGGSNGGGNKSGTVTAKVEGGDATGSLTAGFTYELGEDESCFGGGLIAQSLEVPGESTIDPEVVGLACEGEVSNLKNWDKLEVTFSPSGSADGLTLTLTSGGSEIASTSSPNDTGNLEVSVSGDDS